MRSYAVRTIRFDDFNRRSVHCGGNYMIPYPQTPNSQGQTQNDKKAKPESTKTRGSTFDLKKSSVKLQLKKDIDPLSDGISTIASVFIRALEARKSDSPTSQMLVSMAKSLTSKAFLRGVIDLALGDSGDDKPATE